MRGKTASPAKVPRLGAGKSYREIHRRLGPGRRIIWTVAGLPPFHIWRSPFGGSFFVFSAVALIAAGSASAADLSRPIAIKSPPPLVTPAFTWTGAYVDLNGGVDWENTQTQYSISSPAWGSGGNGRGRLRAIGAIWSACRRHWTRK
jgi:hypothetical protein